jgi:hypothetical protein
MTRKDFPTEIVTAVLVRSRRRCAYCFGLDADTKVKDGQIAHVDRDSANVTVDNAAWLCLKHHARHDATSRQAKGHTPEELRYYRDQLYEYFASSQTGAETFRSRVRKPQGISLEMFDRRVPAYRATISFINTVLKLNNIEIKDMYAFAAATDEALFLFDEQVAEYLTLLYKQGLRLRAISLTIQAPERRTRELIDEEMQLALWFTEQYAEVRKRMARFLRLA